LGHCVYGAVRRHTGLRHRSGHPHCGQQAAAGTAGGVAVWQDFDRAERRWQVSDIKAKRRYSDPTKSDYIIRCMAAENTVRQQDKALAEEKQARAKAELDALWLTDENARLRQRAIGWFIAWAIAVICLAVPAIVEVCK